MAGGVRVDLYSKSTCVVFHLFVYEDQQRLQQAEKCWNRKTTTRKKSSRYMLKMVLHTAAKKKGV